MSLSGRPVSRLSTQTSGSAAALDRFISRNSRIRDATRFIGVAPDHTIRKQAPPLLLLLVQHLLLKQLQGQGEAREKDSR